MAAKKVLIEYIGPHDMVEVGIAVTGAYYPEVKRNVPIEVDAEDAELLLHQSVWRVPVKDDKKNKTDAPTE